MKTNIKLLKGRIEKSYAHFKKHILDYEPEDIFALSKRITAVKDVRDFIVDMELIDEEQAEYLLGFKNPLDMLSVAWEDYLVNETGGDFMTAAFDFLERDDLEDEYATVDEAADILSEIRDSLETLDEIEEQIDELRCEYERMARGLDI